MELHQQIELVGSRQDLADFVVALRSDLEARPDSWENPTLDGFLDAMAAWVGEMDGLYRNIGQEVPETPTWRTIAEILYASRMYE